MKSFFVKLIFLSSFVFLCLVSIDVKKWSMGGFRKEKLLILDQTKISSSPVSIQSALDQPYTYLNRGTQCFVFESEDGKYVLKFLRSDRLKRGFFKKLFSQHPPKKRKEDLMKACQIAHEKFSEITGIIGVHQAFSKDLGYIVLKSKIAQKAKFDLNRFYFILQKKATALDKALLDAKKENNMDYAKRLICSFFELLETRSKALISNSDPNLFDNFAVIEDMVIEIDFGDYFYNPPLEFNKSTYFHEIDRFAQPLREWITRKWPEILPQFDQEYAKVRFHD